jgi:hypothetical protein
MNGNSALSRISIPSARNRFFHEFLCSKPHAALLIGERLSRYEQTLSEKERVGHFDDGSCLGSQKCEVGRTHNGHLPEIVGLIRLEIWVLKEGKRVGRTVYGSCG